MVMNGYLKNSSMKGLNSREMKKYYVYMSLSMAPVCYEIIYFSSTTLKESGTSLKMLKSRA
jgi:hypothetical protein